MFILFNHFGISEFLQMWIDLQPQYMFYHFNNRLEDCSLDYSNNCFVNSEVEVKKIIFSSLNL
jgi:hypothetical protein